MLRITCGNGDSVVLPASDDCLIRVTTTPNGALLPYVKTVRTPRTCTRAVLAVASGDGVEEEEDFRGWQFFNWKRTRGCLPAPPNNVALIILRGAQRFTGRAQAPYATWPEYLARAEQPAAPPVAQVTLTPLPQAPAPPIAQVAPSAPATVPAPSQTPAAPRTPPAGPRAGGDAPTPGAAAGPPRAAGSARALVVSATGRGGTSRALPPTLPHHDLSALTGTPIVADPTTTPNPMFTPWPSRFLPADPAAAADRSAQV
jgi:hypothetical protein